MKTITENRKARHNYEFLDNYVAGIQLNGCEIKSVRRGCVNISDSYCFIDDSGVWIKNMYIKEYFNRGYCISDPNRDRRLLLRKQEIRKLSQKVKTKGLTIIPVRLFINDKGLAKLEITLGKGKHDYDKKQSIKERDLKRDMERSLI